MSRTARLPAALIVALACLPAQAAQRAFVASTGNDANAASGCIAALPCRSFQAAHTAVDPGGEIVALDTAGFGTVVISKSVSIIGNPGAIPSISVSTVSAVRIATPGVRVTLRNLNINGVGAAVGIPGIDMSDGAALTIENCVISNINDSGLGVYELASAPEVRIVDSVMRGNLNGAMISGNASVDISGSHFAGNATGIYVQQMAGGVLNVAINDSVISGNTTAVFNYAADGTSRVSVNRVIASNGHSGFFNFGDGGTAVLTVGNSLVSGNVIGMQNFFNNSGGAAVFESLGDNIVRQNADATLGVITPVSGT